MVEVINMYEYAVKKNKAKDKIIQRKYDFLKDETLASGVELYHGTSMDSAHQILNEGFNFKGLPSQLGKGLYTTSNEETLSKYIKDDPAVLSVKTKKDLQGQRADMSSEDEEINPAVLQELMLMVERNIAITPEIIQTIRSGITFNGDWKAIKNDVKLNESNDFIRTEEHNMVCMLDSHNFLVPFIEGAGLPFHLVPTWLDQYKFNESARENLEIEMGGEDIITRVKTIKEERERARRESRESRESSGDCCCAVQ